MPEPWYDLKLDLDEPVAAALSQLLGALKATVSLLGRGARSSSRRPHCRRRRTTAAAASGHAVFGAAARRNVHGGAAGYCYDAGPTNYLPRTHRAAGLGQRPDGRRGRVSSSRRRRAASLPRRGDAVIFDSRASIAAARTPAGRVVFSSRSFQARDAWRHLAAAADNPALLDALRGRYCLDRAGRLVAVARSAGMAWLAAAAVAGCTPPSAGSLRSP